MFPSRSAMALKKFLEVLLFSFVAFLLMACKPEQTVSSNPKQNSPDPTVDYCHLPSGQQGIAITGRSLRPSDAASLKFEGQASRLSLHDDIIYPGFLSSVAAKGTIIGLYLNRSSLIDGAEKELASLKDLVYINYSKPATKNEWLKHLSQIEGLKEITVSDPFFTGEGFESFPETSRIERLELGDSPLSNAGLKAISKLKNLEYLSFRFQQSHAEVVCCLASLPKLHSFFSSNKNEDEFLKSILCLKYLDELPTTATSISDEGMKTLSKFEFLNSLSLSGTRVSDQGLAHMANHKHIKEIYLSNGVITGNGLSTLTTMPQLEGLVIKNVTLSDENIESLKQLQNLKSLNLSKAKIPRSDFSFLCSLPKLEELCLLGTGVDDRVVPCLERLEHLNNLNLMDTLVSRKTIECCAKLKKLRTLTIWKCPNIDASCFETLSTLKQLSVLNLDDKQVSRSDYQKLRRNLPETKIDDPYGFYLH